MSIITQKSFFVLLFLASSLVTWANTSLGNEGTGTEHRKTVGKVVPAPPTIIGAVPESCGYQFANDPTSFVKLTAAGCDGRTPKWYESNGTLLIEGVNPFFMPITADKTVYVTCTDNDGESLPSASIVAKYVKAATTTPTITANGNSTYTVRCMGEPVTLQANETDGTYFYRWMRSPGTTAINHTVVQQGQGVAAFTAYENGNYSLEMYALECPMVTRYSAPVYVNILENPSKPTIIGDSTFCSDKSINLTALSTRGGSSNFTYNWFLNGVKQDTATTNTLNNIKLTATTQVQAVYVQEDQTCVSALSDVYKVRALIASGKPTITSSKKGAAICQGDTLILTSSQASAYKWNTGVTTAAITGINKAGKYAVQTYSEDGCISPTSDTISIIVYTRPATPTISSSKKGAAICQGDTLTLTSSQATAYKWNTGATTTSIAGINKAGKYAVQTYSKDGCISPTSDTVTITVYTRPITPTITSSKANATICQGDTLSLSSSSGLKYVWNDGSSSRIVAGINKVSTYTVQTIDSNGCVSDKSIATTIKVNALPAKPVISASGSTTFCDGFSITLTSTPELTYSWSNSSTTRSIDIKKSSSLSLTVKDANGCISPVSDITTITVLPLPAAPTIAFDGSDFGGKPMAIFCSRDNVDYAKVNSVNILATSPYEVTWNTGSAGKALNTVKISGDYYAIATQKYTDGNACESLKSAILTVLVKENPDVVASGATITKDGTFILNATNFPNGGNYEWKYNGTLVTDANNVAITTQNLKVSKYGDYIARRQLIYTVAAPLNQLACYSDYTKAYTFKEDIDFKGLSIYPNPGNGAFTIETLDNLKNVEISIYDLFGRIIWSKTYTGITTKTPIDLTSQPIGTYLLRCKADGFDVTKRIITNR